MNVFSLGFNLIGVVLKLKEVVGLFDKALKRRDNMELEMGMDRVVLYCGLTVYCEGFFLGERI